MLHYRPPLRDIRFLIEEWLGAAEDWRRMPGLAHVDAPLFNAVLEEGARFAADVLAPLNAPGDAEACRFDAGSVKHRAGFAQPTRASWTPAGRPCAALANTAARPSADRERRALRDVHFGEPCWSMYPAIVHGAYECLERCASPELKREYLARIVSGEWLATMCLTEAGRAATWGCCDAVPSRGRRIIPSVGHQDIHIGGRARPHAEHRASRARTAAGCARGEPGYLLVPRAGRRSRRAPGPKRGALRRH